jgi:hypothetical protein
MTKIEAYRSAHVIRPTVRGRDGQQACAVDGIAIWPNKGGRYRHDPGEVAAAAEEAGRLAVWRARHEL